MFAQQMRGKTCAASGWQALEAATEAPHIIRSLVKLSPIFVGLIFKKAELPSLNCRRGNSASLKIVDMQWPLFKSIVDEDVHTNCLFE